MTTRQKSFSKLRSSIGGIYAWRLTQARTASIGPKSNAEYQRVLKEADFAFRQAFAFCPYSPEAVFRYCQLLLQLRRFDDALLIAETCLKLDPYNGQVRGLVETIKQIKKESAGADQFRGNFLRAEEEVRTNPNNFQAAFDLAGDYLQMQQTDRAVAVLEKMRENPKADPGALRSLLQAYASFGNTDGLAEDRREAGGASACQPGQSSGGAGPGGGIPVFAQDRKGASGPGPSSE